MPKHPSKQDLSKCEKQERNDIELETFTGGMIQQAIVRCNNSKDIGLDVLGDNITFKHICNQPMEWKPKSYADDCTCYWMSINVQVT